VISAYQPVAHVVSRIPAKSIQSLRNSQRTPKFAAGCVHGRDCLRIGQIRQAQPALLALRVFEIERLPAILAFEQLHFVRPCWLAFSPNCRALENRLLVDKTPVFIQKLKILRRRVAGVPAQFQRYGSSLPTSGFIARKTLPGEAYPGLAQAKRVAAHFTSPIVTPSTRCPLDMCRQMLDSMLLLAKNLRPHAK
jgi:hypothetical protein